jgi:hypothetical protein
MNVGIRTLGRAPEKNSWAVGPGRGGLMTSALLQKAQKTTQLQFCVTLFERTIAARKRDWYCVNLFLFSPFFLSLCKCTKLFSPPHGLATNCFLCKMVSSSALSSRLPLVIGPKILRSNFSRNKSFISFLRTEKKVDECAILLY